MKLSRISDNVQKIAEAISSVLEVDVTISDESLVRIAATGLYAGQIGDGISASSIFGYALKNGKDYIIDDPRTNRVCLSCDRKDRCMEVAEVCSPIRHEGRIIGVIGLIAFEEAQKVRLLSNKENLLIFLRRMGDLITAKLSDTEKNDRIEVLAKELQVIIDSFDRGVVFVNCEGRIMHFNEKARIIFGDRTFTGEPKGLTAFVKDVVRLRQDANDDKPIRNREYVYESGRGESCLIFDMNSMSVKKEKIGFLISFSRKRDVLSVFHDVAGTGPEITFEDILGKSAAILRAKEYAKKASKSPSTILIQGESGTGKELFARSMHFESERRHMPFIPVNCAAIPENLLESELFGYEEGAFTGAARGGKTGKFELAHRGTILLDEIGDMPIHLQKKLLRVLQENTIERVGGDHCFRVDIRVIAATNKDIEKLVAEGAFREDLFYRLNVIPIHLPPLRERKDDIPILTDFFVNKYSEKFKKSIRGVQRDVLKVFKDYDWPGNIRELENAVEYAVNMSGGDSIALGDIHKRMIGKNMQGFRGEEDAPIRQIEDLERTEMLRAIERYGRSENGMRLCVRDLGMSRATWYRKVKKYGI